MPWSCSLCDSLRLGWCCDKGCNCPSGHKLPYRLADHHVRRFGPVIISRLVWNWSSLIVIDLCQITKYDYGESQNMSNSSPIKVARSYTRTSSSYWGCATESIHRELFYGCLLSLFELKLDSLAKHLLKKKISNTAPLTAMKGSYEPSSIVFCKGKLSFKDWRLGSPIGLWALLGTVARGCIPSGCLGFECCWVRLPAWLLATTKGPLR